MTFAESLDRFFEIKARGSTISTEVKGGILVFLSMAYIISVNPAMMADAGMPWGQAFTATILMSIIAMVIMALYARYPVALAPTMGVNAFVTYTVILAMGFSWSEALAAVVISGLIFFLISISGVRKRLLDQIPSGVRHGITAGIGCFIAFIGLQGAGLIASDPSTLVSLGNLGEPMVLLGLFCILLTLLLYAMKVPGAILIGMIATALIGVVAGLIAIPDALVASPELPDFTLFADGFNSEIVSIEFVMVVLALVFMQFFDSTGTLMALGTRAGLMDENGNVTCEKALTVDAGASVVSGVVGATPVGSFAESIVGIESGARTGLMSLVVAAFFAVSLFIGPLFSIMNSSCTVGALVLVGVAMIASLRDVEWDSWPTTVAVLFTILFMVLTYSIADGIGFGFIAYCVAMIGAGRAREVKPLIYAVAVISVIYFVSFAVILPA